MSDNRKSFHLDLELSIPLKPNFRDQKLLPRSPFLNTSVNQSPPRRSFKRTVLQQERIPIPIYISK